MKKRFEKRWIGKIDGKEVIMSFQFDTKDKCKLVNVLVLR